MSEVTVDGDEFAFLNRTGWTAGKVPLWFVFAGRPWSDFHTLGDVANEGRTSEVERESWPSSVFPLDTAVDQSTHPDRDRWQVQCHGCHALYSGTTAELVAYVLDLEQAESGVMPCRVQGTPAPPIHGE